jgi:hypothetical protein
MSLNELGLVKIYITGRKTISYRESIYPPNFLPLQNHGYGPASCIAHYSAHNIKKMHCNTSSALYLLPGSIKTCSLLYLLPGSICVNGLFVKTALYNINMNR